MYLYIYTASLSLYLYIYGVYISLSLLTLSSSANPSSYFAPLHPLDHDSQCLPTQCRHPHSAVAHHRDSCAGGNKAYQIRTEAVQKLRAPRPTIKLDGQFNLVFLLFQWKMTITSKNNVLFVCGRSQIDHVFFWGVRFSA